MLVFGTRRLAESRRRALRTTEGMDYVKSEWMESGDDPGLSPTIFMVEQPPRTRLDAHFHGENQFQLFVKGSGTIGRTRIEPVTVHYAGAYTAYGPLVSGAEGIHYLTIRPVYESGANFVKRSRDRMVQGPKRHAASRPVAPQAPAALRVLDHCESVDVLPVAEDGLGARVLRLPPGAAARTPFPAAADGVFMVVLSGNLRHEDGEIGIWESVYASTPDEWPGLSAGPSGAEVIFLFTPAKAAAYCKTTPDHTGHVQTTGDD